jgi:hypothetical protein
LLWEPALRCIPLTASSTNGLRLAGALGFRFITFSLKKQHRKPMTVLQQNPLRALTNRQPEPRMPCLSALLRHIRWPHTSGFHPKRRWLVTVISSLLDVARVLQPIHLSLSTKVVTPREFKATSKFSNRIPALNKAFKNTEVTILPRFGHALLKYFSLRNAILSSAIAKSSDRRIAIGASITARLWSADRGNSLHWESPNIYSQNIRMPWL